MSQVMEQIQGIKHFDKVAEGIYRGGQPNDVGWAYLNQLGITSVIKLNKDSEGSDDGCFQFNMILTRCPLDTEDQLFGLSRAECQTLLSAVSTIAPGTYVHCTHGQDRTGLMIGLYRVARCGWSIGQAYDEMKAHGFHWELLGLLTCWHHLTEPYRTKMHD